MGPHDTLFKRAFGVPRHAAGLIRTMLPPGLVARMDLDALELVPTSFVDPEMGHRHADLLFAVPLDGEGAFVYFLVEHQSEPDALMVFRLLTYLQRIWAAILRDDPARRTLPIVVPIVVHHGRGGWTAPVSLHELVEGLDAHPGLAPFVPDFTMLLDDLAHRDDEALLRRPLAPFPKVALWVLRDARAADALFRSLRSWAHELHELVASGGREDIDTIVRYLFRVVDDVSYETIRDRFIEVIPEVEAAMASPAEQLIEKGLQKGLQRGRQEGRREANRATLARLIRLRFGPPGPGVEARIAAATPEDLERWLERFANAESLDAVFAD